MKTNENLKRVFVFFAGSNLSKLTRKLEEIEERGQSHVVIAFSLAAEKELQSQNIQCRSAELFFPTNKRENMHKRSLSLARNWYKNKVPSDLVSFLGISLGTLLEIPVYSVFLKIIKIVETWVSIIKETKADEILLFTDCSLPAAIGKYVIEELNTDLTVFPQTRLKTFIFLIKNKTWKAIRKLYYSSMIKHHIKLKKFMLGAKTTYKEKAPKGKHFLFVFTSGTTSGFKTLFPVIEELKQHRNVKATILTNSFQAMEKLKAEGMPFLTFEDITKSEANRKTKMKRRQLENCWKKISENPEFKNLFRYDGLSLWEFLEEEISLYFRYEMANLVRYIDSLHVFLRLKMINAVVVSHDNHALGRLAVMVADKLRIPSLLVLHGPTTAPFSDIKLPIYATKAAIWGELTKKWFVEKGCSPSKLVITGCPRFDEYVKKNPKTIHRVGARKLQLMRKKKTIMIAAGPLQTSGHRLLVEPLISSLNQLNDIQLVIKLHPLDQNPDLYYPVIRNMKSSVPVSIVRDFDLHSLLRLCDVVVTESSTVGLEAMILGKPVISINFSDSPDILPYAKSGAAISVYRPSALLEALKKVLYDKRVQRKLKDAQKKFVQRYASTPGEASQLVVKLLMDMTQQREGKKLPPSSVPSISKWESTYV